jgi:glycosyltransferase involved in cell wall biosynthesis
MNNLPKHPRIIFLNQWAGPLFRGLAHDISKKWPPGLLLTGHPDALKSEQTDSLSIVAAPKYQRRSYLSRVLSGIHYILYALFYCWKLPLDTLVFSMSEPLCLGAVGYLCKRLRGQRYVILVYDIYPDALIQFGVLKKSGLAARIWRRLNRLVWENAEIVFTIGEAMAGSLEQMFDASKTLPGKVIFIPNWADTDWIRPVAKDKNEFAKKYGQVGKLTVMYSGNLGKTHDIETIIAAARELKEYDSIHFMIIGEGAKKDLVKQAKYKDALDNLTILPFQPEDVLSTSLPTADISIITLDKGCETLSAPSKTCYAMAAGSALIGLCNNESEIAHIINRHNCGIVVSPGDTNAMVNGIKDLLNDKAKLCRYQTNSRQAAERYYSRKNTSQYVEALCAIKLLQQ